MAQVRWTEETDRWLRDIFDYIATDNPDAAQKVVADIYEKAQLLRRFPEIGYKYRTEPEGEIRIRSSSGCSGQAFTRGRLRVRPLLIRNPVSRAC